MHEVVRITKSIKTLILEIVGGNGPSHIKEVHLQVVEFRPAGFEPAGRHASENAPCGQRFDDGGSALRQAQCHRTRTSGQLAASEERRSEATSGTWKFLSEGATHDRGAAMLI